jgi:hypothetical protein
VTLYARELPRRSSIRQPANGNLPMHEKYSFISWRTGTTPRLLNESWYPFSHCMKMMRGIYISLPIPAGVIGSVMKHAACFREGVVCVEAMFRNLFPRCFIAISEALNQLPCSRSRAQPMVVRNLIESHYPPYIDPAIY